MGRMTDKMVSWYEGLSEKNKAYVTGFVVGVVLAIIVIAAMS